MIKIKGINNKKILICLSIGLLFGLVNLFMFLYNNYVDEVNAFIFLVLLFNGLQLNIGSIFVGNYDKISPVFSSVLIVFIPTLFGGIIGAFSNKKWKYWFFIVGYIVIQLWCGWVIISNTKWG